MNNGTIIKHISNQYVVLDEQSKVAYTCVAMGKLRKGKSPIVGDYVKYEMLHDKYVIQKVLPRKNELIRPVIANVDQAIITMSAKDPDFSTALLDRLIFLVCYERIKPIICITKMDLVDESDITHTYIEDYKQSGYTVIETGADRDTKAIEDILKGRISVLCGQSGAGKSSLLNRINPSFNLHTQEISKALGRGKHTTRHCELFEIKGGWIADTPGFSSLDFSHMQPLQLAASIVDFKAYEGACKFSDCIHINEPGCAVKEAVEAKKLSQIRYDSYKEVLYLMQQTKKKY